MEIKEIIELMKAVAESELTAFELEQGDTKLVMKREKKLVQPAVTVVESAAGAGKQAVRMAESGREMSGESGNSGQETASDKVVRCPLVGTFYSSPSPEAEDFVKVGDVVKKGQVIGIVEAMKLMNEIESEYDGIVEAVLVKNEETVEYGQPLFRIQ